MPFRDKHGRFCGTLIRKDTGNHWTRNFFVLDEEKCLLRYFPHIEGSVSETFVCFLCSNSCLGTQVHLTFANYRKQEITLFVVVYYENILAQVPKLQNRVSLQFLFRFNCVSPGIF